MARQLFDLSEIDLEGVEYSWEEVAQINPQCGDMRQLDHVIWISEERRQGLGVKYVRDDEFWVPGHIPGRPLFPGVLMIEAAAQLASIMHHRRCGPAKFVGFTRCESVAFRGQVVPGDTLYILGAEVSMRRRRFIIDTQAVVNNELVLEAQVIGMEM